MVAQPDSEIVGIPPAHAKNLREHPFGMTRKSEHPAEGGRLHLLYCRRGFYRQRQFQNETRPYRVIFFHANRSAMLLHDPAYDV
jgi:hypothetical protein